MPDGPVERTPSTGHDPLEPRVSRLETEMRDVRDAIAELKTIVLVMEGKLDTAIARIETKLDATLPHLATKAEIAQLEVKLAEKPSKTYMWGVLAALLTAYACGLAALAVLK